MLILGSIDSGPVLPLLRRAPSRGRALSCGALALLLLLAGGMGPASAQVPLQLLRRVGGPGQSATEGAPLPPGTRVAVLRYSADQPHTLKNAGISREELARRVLNRDSLLRLVGDGKTPRPYARTAQSGDILYVLARTPSDSLYESYVDTGEAFVPGFDAVQSGRMTMGPVPPEARRRYRSVFRLRQEEKSASDVTSSPDTTPAAGTESARAPKRTENRTASPADAEDGSNPIERWGLLTGWVIGLLVGGAAAWLFFSTRLRRAEAERDELRIELQDLKSQQFREATGTTLSEPANSAEDAPPASPPEEPERLRAAYNTLRKQNEQLRGENEALKREIGKIRQHLQNLQDRDN